MWAVYVLQSQWVSFLSCFGLKRFGFVYFAYQWGTFFLVPHQHCSPGSLSRAGFSKCSKNSLRYGNLCSLNKQSIWVRRKKISYHEPYIYWADAFLIRAPSLVDRSVNVSGKRERWEENELFIVEGCQASICQPSNLTVHSLRSKRFCAVREQTFTNSPPVVVGVNKVTFINFNLTNI